MLACKEYIIIYNTDLLLFTASAFRRSMAGSRGTNTAENIISMGQEARDYIAEDSGGRSLMITIEDVKAWLEGKNTPYEVMVDSATGTDVYIVKHHSEAAGIDYQGVIAVPPGHFMMVKVVGADLSKYHPRKCVAVLQQFNGLMNRRKTADSYNYNIEGKNLIIVFWPENTDCEHIRRYLDFGFNRLDFMYRNLEKLEIAD